MRLDHLLSKETILRDYGRGSDRKVRFAKANEKFKLGTKTDINSQDIKDKVREDVVRCSIFRVQSPDTYGGVAQLGEHLPCKQGVKSSNLFISTKGIKEG